MRQKNILISSLLYGSLIVSFCYLLCSCNKQKTDYVFKADWEYINKSSKNIEIKGIEDFSYPNELDVKIKRGGKYIITLNELGGENEVPPTGYPMPLFKENCQIIIEGKSYNIKDEIFFRNRTNYQIEKKSFNNYKFTYEFTDNIIALIIKQ